jgi:hypothetical protein
MPSPPRLPLAPALFVNRLAAVDEMAIAEVRKFRKKIM